jgi:fructosamine-3-kinase
VDETVPVDPDWLDRLLIRSGLPPATGFVELSGGTFNMVLQATTAAGDVIVKVPPAPAVPLMRYERGITGTEALFYRLAAEHGIGSVPRTLYHGRVDEIEALVLSTCPGRPWPEMTDQLDDDQRRAIRRQVGRELAALHSITGPGYGYPASPLAASWRAAFTNMMAAVLDDAARFGVLLPRSQTQVAAIVERVSPVLDGVATPALVHFDLWDGNILVDIREDGPRLGGLIDAERAFWGDPIAELVSLRLLGDIEPDESLLAGYREAGGQVVLDRSARTRLTLYRLYLYLIMWVEVVPRSFDEGRIAWLRRSVFGPIAAMLDALEHS